MERAVLVAGYYGFGNTGDEAILQAIVSKLGDRARLTVVSGNPARTRERHGVETVPWRDVLSIADAVRASDLVLVGGGGLFQDYEELDPSTLLTPRHGGITFYAGPAVLAAAAAKPVALYGLGFGPLASPEARRIVRAVAEAASFLSVRDEGSRDLLVATWVAAGRIRLSADPAFLLAPERVRPEDLLIGMGIEPRAPIAGVSLRPWSRGVDPEVWEGDVAAALDLFLERTGGTLVFVPFEKSPWSREDDFALNARMCRRLRHADRALALPGLLPPPETAGLLAGCDLVVAMRLHAGLFAIAGGVPPVAIAYDPKVAALFSRAGLQDFVEPLNGLSTESLFTKMERALAERPRLQAALSAAAAAQKRLAETDLEAVAALIAHPPAAPAVPFAMMSLLDDALRGHLVGVHELSAEVEVLRGDRAAADLRMADLERRLAASEATEAALRRSDAELSDRLDAGGKAHRREVELLERQSVEAREELSKIQTSRFWKTINLYWRARRAAARLSRPARQTLGRLLGRPPADWVGPDRALEAAASAPLPQTDNRHEVVCFPGSQAAGEAALRLARAGHRVFVIEPRPRSDGPPAAIEERSPNLFAVTLGGAEKPAGEAVFKALDSLRRDRSFGATLSLVTDPAWTPTAERLRRERAWPILTDLPDSSAGDEAWHDAACRAFPKLSVIVVTWNGRDFNRLCLQSLAARTEWPNLEILVVDNASTDGSREILEETSRRDPRIRLIANDENRGFAAASNQGFAASTGDYLVLLNNDTVVTRGWATALVRHLAADPRLGLVGPVTNAIANAAKVDAGYRGMADLSAWAADWVRAHDGDAFDIPMLALFCAALPRRVLEEVGPLDERFGIGLFEDDDYSRRVRARGYTILCARDAFVHHWQMASFRKMSKEAYFALYSENRRRYDEKWGDAGRAAPAAPAPPAPARTVAVREEHRSQLARVIERASGGRGAVVFLPSVGWGIHLFQRPHHLARVFAKLGYAVVFDSSNAEDRVDGFKEIEPNLFLFRGPSSLLHEIPSPFLWAFPYNFHLADGYPQPATTVYDWIDDLDVFPYDRRLLEDNHARGLAEATVVASVARRLHERALRTRPDALYLPNGVEYERFAAPAAPARDEELLHFLTPGAPVAGYYGALAEWFDYTLVDAVAGLKPDWRFVLIGPQYDKSLEGQPLFERGNVAWLGPRDYVTLPGYLSLFDVATIPFRLNPITLATSPLKLYEYFAGAKPVVTTALTECQAYPEVRIAGTPEEFVGALETARVEGRDPAFRARLRSLGRENSWSARVETVIRALAGR